MQIGLYAQVTYVLVAPRQWPRDPVEKRKVAIQGHSRSYYFGVSEKPLRYYRHITIQLALYSQVWKIYSSERRSMNRHFK